MAFALVKRWMHVLEWPLLARCSLIMFLYASLEVFYLIWKSVILASPSSHLYFNLDLMRECFAVSLLLLGTSFTLAAGSYILLQNYWAKLIIPYVCTFFIMASLAYNGFLIGMMTPATGIILVGLPMLGVLLLGRRYTYPPLIVGIFIVVSITYLSMSGKIPYAPLFKKSMFAPNKNSIFWPRILAFL